mmetsp:Transcript_68282/g.113032  ORF Transcript_68282/g.113032 Transcript_68282/m.113032 type:complete len:473 (+) Transcript_68282:131-1549(+)
MQTSGATATSLRESTSFNREFVDELQRTNPGALAWLRSTSGVLFQAALILTYVGLETVAGFLTSFALKPAAGTKFKPLPSSIIVMNSGLSIVVGLLITAATSVISEKMPVARSITKTFRDVFQWRTICSYSVVAAFFSIAAVFSKMAYAKMDAGLKKILDQLRLPVTAGMSALIIGKRYTLREWLTLLMVPLAVCCFYVADVEHDEVTELHATCRYPSHCFSELSYDVCGIRVDGATMIGTAIRDSRNTNSTRHNITSFPVEASRTDFQGLIFSVLATFFNCIGSLYFEKMMKITASTPFPTQKVQLETTGFLVAIAMSFIVPLWIDDKGGKAIWWAKNEAEGSGEGFFQGYNSLTIIVIGFDMLMAWMSGIIVKQFSAVVQKIAKCFILLLTVFSAGTFLKPCHADPLPMTMYSLAFITAAATLLFGTMPKEGATRAPPTQVRPSPQEPLPARGHLTESAIQLLEGASRKQ